MSQAVPLQRCLVRGAHSMWLLGSNPPIRIRAPFKKIGHSADSSCNTENLVEEAQVSPPGGKRNFPAKIDEEEYAQVAAGETGAACESDGFAKGDHAASCCCCVRTCSPTFSSIARQMRDTP